MLIFFTNNETTEVQNVCGYSTHVQSVNFFIFIIKQVFSRCYSPTYISIYWTIANLCRFCLKTKCNCLYFSIFFFKPQHMTLFIFYTMSFILWYFSTSFYFPVLQSFFCDMIGFQVGHRKNSNHHTYII